MMTVAQKAKELLIGIPKEQWIIGSFTNGIDKCCAIGHYQRLTSGYCTNYSFDNCSDYNPYTSFNPDKESVLRIISIRYFREVHNIENMSIACVNNNGDGISNDRYKLHKLGYIEDNPKDRVMHLLDDMIKAGY